MTTKANGDKLEGTLPTYTNYPDPVQQNVNMHSMDWAYGVGNKTVDFVAPTAPVLSSSAHTATTVTLGWTASTDTGSGVAGYDVYNGPTLVHTVVGSLAYTVTALTTATAYTFTVKARDVVGNVSTSNAVAVTTS